MRQWRMIGEPSLDELLGDEMMEQVTQRAGLDVTELRRWLVEIARRIAERDQPCSCHGAAIG